MNHGNFLAFAVLSKFLKFLSLGFPVKFEASDMAISSYIVDGAGIVYVNS